LAKDRWKPVIPDPGRPRRPTEARRRSRPMRETNVVWKSLILLAVSAVLWGPASLAGDWYTEQVDTVVGFADIACHDAGGGAEVGIAYLHWRSHKGKDKGGYEIWFASRRGSSWDRTLVADLSSDTTTHWRHLDCAYTPDGWPAVVFLLGDTIRYAEWNGDGWSGSTVESVSLAENEGVTWMLGKNALAFDAAGRPAVAYERHITVSVKVKGKTTTSTTCSMKLARRDSSGDWSRETVRTRTPTLPVGLEYAATAPSPALAFDAQGYPVIGYAEDREEDPSGWGHAESPIILRWDGSDWAAEDLPVREDVYQLYGMSLALDGSRHPHLLYTEIWSADGYSYEMRYARWTGEAWESEVVAESCSGRNIVWDSSTGQPVIAFNDNGLITVGTRDASGWTFDGVDCAGYGAVAVDNSGNAFVVYHYGTYGRIYPLMFAHR
jgi:hypothetical protein